MNKKTPKYEKIEVELSIPELKSAIKQITSHYRPESKSIIEEWTSASVGDTELMFALGQATFNEYVCHALETELVKIKEGTSDFQQWAKTNKKTSKKKASK